MAAALSAAPASGSYSSRAANPSTIPLVGTTRTVLVASSHTCMATGRMLSLLGSSTTSSEGTDSTTSRIWAVDGFMDWPPATR